MLALRVAQPRPPHLPRDRQLALPGLRLDAVAVASLLWLAERDRSTARSAGESARSASDLERDDRRPILRETALRGRLTADRSFRPDRQRHAELDVRALRHGVEDDDDP